MSTHPSLLSRVHNRPKISDLKSGKFNIESLDSQVLEEVGKKTAKSYRELQQRIDREEQLAVIQRKMEMKAALREKVKPIKQVTSETKSSAPVYLWPQERKK